MKPEPLLSRLPLACWGAAPAAFTPPPLLDEWFLLCFQLSCPIDGRFGVSPHEGILLAGRAQIACEARRLYLLILHVVGNNNQVGTRSDRFQASFAGRHQFLHTLHLQIVSQNVDVRLPAAHLVYGDGREADRRAFLPLINAAVAEQNHWHPCEQSFEHIHLGTSKNSSRQVAANLTR